MTTEERQPWYIYYKEGLRPPYFMQFSTRSQSEIHHAFLALTGQRVGLLADTRFQVTNEKLLREYAWWWRQVAHPWMTYESEDRDCDNFARAFHGDIGKWWGWCAAPNLLVWSSYLGGHAYNLHIAFGDVAAGDRELKVFFIEPQTGEVRLLEKDHFVQYQPWLVMVNGKPEALTSVGNRVGGCCGN